MMYRRVKQVSSRGGFSWERGRHKERVNECEYSGFVLYTHMKIED
jgi:hypothetical protein